MKKILLSAFALTALLTTGASAASNSVGVGGEFTIGYVHSSLEDVNGNGVNISYNFNLPVFTNGGTDKFFFVGGGFDVDMIAMDDGVTSDSSGLYGGEPKIYVGYNYGDFNVKAGAGYEWATIDSTTLSGATVSASAGWYFSEKYGVEVTYKHGSMELDVPTSPSLDMDNVGVNFVMHY